MNYSEEEITLSYAILSFGEGKTSSMSHYHCNAHDKG
jgi:hypothetical protein